MKSIHVAAALMTCGATFAAPPATERLVWFGTYTAPRKDAPRSEGIYVSRFNEATGALTEPVLAAAVRNPSFLALHPRVPVLYGVSEIADADGKPAGGVIAFRIDERTGTLTRMNERLSGGAGPCHVAVDTQGRAVLAANYGGGSAICLGLEPDGSLKPAAIGTPGGFIQHAWARIGEAGIDPARQEKPHAHSVDVAADGRFAFVCDLGLDEVLVHALDRDRATLASHSSTKLKAGAGPRHLAIHPDGRRAWCVNELDLTVTEFTYDGGAGRLTPGASHSTLPADTADRKGISCAEIAVHPRGRFLYASNRGHDSIAMFRIADDSPVLEFLGVEPARVKTPRHFAIDPTGTFLLAAGQDSDTVAVFTIDPGTGRLAFTDRTIRVPKPVCVLFGRPN